MLTIPLLVTLIAVPSGVPDKPLPLNSQLIISVIAPLPFTCTSISDDEVVISNVQAESVICDAPFCTISKVLSLNDTPVKVACALPFTVIPVAHTPQTPPFMAISAPAPVTVIALLTLGPDKDVVPKIVLLSNSTYALFTLIPVPLPTKKQVVNP